MIKLLKQSVAIGMLAFSTPAFADEAPSQFLPEIAKSCSNTLGFNTQCIGMAANACMHASGSFGDPNIAKWCLSQETDYWDAKLNSAYQDLMVELQRIEDEAGQTMLQTPESLRAMQRNWIAYRDARCEFEYAQYTNGSGGAGSSTVSIYECQMQATGEQAIYLDKRLSQAMMW